MSRTKAELDLTTRLLQRVDAYCKRKGISRARVATLAVNDGDVFGRVDRGGTLTVRTYERILRWLDQAERELREGEAA